MSNASPGEYMSKIFTLMLTCSLMEYLYRPITAMSIDSCNANDPFAVLTLSICARNSLTFLSLRAMQVLAMKQCKLWMKQHPQRTIWKDKRRFDHLRITLIPGQ